MYKQLNLFEPPISKKYVDDDRYRIEAERNDFGDVPFHAEVAITDKRESRRIRLLRLATPCHGTWFEVGITGEGSTRCDFSVTQYEPDCVHLGSYLGNLTENGRLRFFGDVLYLNRSLQAVSPHFDREDYFGWNVEQGLKLIAMIREEALQNAGKEIDTLRQVQA